MTVIGSIQRNDAQAGELATLQRLLDDRDGTIRDLLRHWLDAEAEERRRLIGLLTAPERRSLWQRWLR
jgi:hypothetical protein